MSRSRMNITKALQIARREFLATVMTKGFLIACWSCR